MTNCADDFTVEDEDTVDSPFISAEKRAALIEETVFMGILTRTDMERAWMGDYGPDEYPGREWFEGIE